MSSTPSLLDPTDRASQRDEDAQYYRQVLHELVEIGARLARTIDRQAAAEPGAAPEQADQPAPASDLTPKLAIAFDRVARTVRRTIALARTLTDPAPPRPSGRAAEAARRHRHAARRETDGAEAEAPHADLHERPEGPDPGLDLDPDDGDLDERSLADLLALIPRDLGLAALTDAQLSQRRAPADADAPRPRAVRPSTGQPRGAQPAAPPGAVPPQAPPTPGAPRPTSPTRPGTGPPRS